MPGYNEEFEKVLKIFNEIGSTSSKNDKLRIAREYSELAVFKKCVLYALNPRFNFYMNQAPGPEYALYESHNVDPFDILDQLASRELSGNHAKMEVEGLLSVMTPSARELFLRMLTQKPRIGATISTFNKVWGEDFIPVVPCIKARELNDKNLANIEYPAYTQIKSDGTRCIAHKLNGQVKLVSRNGSVFTNMDYILSAATDILKDLPDGSFIDGEIVFHSGSTGKALPRKISNGLASKSIKGSLKKHFSGDADDYPVYTVWDMVIKGNEIHPYKDRLAHVHGFLVNYDHRMVIVQTRIVLNVDEALVNYKEARKDGEEGVILKNMYCAWENTRSKHLVKMKAFHEADLRVVAIHNGDVGGKHQHVLGRITCVTDDGMIKVDVGGGFSDKERADSIDIGSIVTVRFNDVIENAGTSNTASQAKSLYIPTFIEIRVDKDETSTFAEILAVKDS